MKYCLDIPSTATTMPFRSQPEVMAAYYATHIECTAWRGANCIAEKYWMETEDGEYILEEVIVEEGEYVSL